jgi:hypothetical protein
MPKYDMFTASLRTDLKRNGLTLDQAADVASKSTRQFMREVRGETKLGLMPVDTVATLAQKGAISNSTVEAWWKEVRTELKFKHQKKKPPITSGQKKLLNVSLPIIER